MNTNELKILATREELNQAVRELNNKKEIEIMVKYCIFKLAKKYKIKYNEDTGIDGITIMDLIQETNLSFCTDKRRNWYKSSLSSFRKQFYGALDSVIGTAVKKYYKNLDKKNAYWLVNYADSVDPATAKNDFYLHWNKFKNDMIEIGASQLEIEIFDAYFIQGLKRNEIAEIFKHTPQQITVIKKRIDRHLIEISKRWR
jgi:hypothetical protein